MLVCFGLMPPVSVADEFDTVQFRTAINKAWASNLFRLSDNPISDQITTSTVGVKLDKKYAMQRFVVDLSTVDNKYQKNDFLDYTANNYDAAWYWSLTPSFTGKLSSMRTESLNGFGDFRSLSQNIRLVNTQQFLGEYSPFKVWSFIGGATHTSASNSQTFNAQADFDALAFDYGARYNYASGTNITFLAHHRRGEFKNRILNSSTLLDNGYDENEFEMDVVLKEMSKSKLSGKLSWLDRQYDNFSTRDYQAWMGDIKYDLSLTGHLLMKTSLSRTVGVFETNYSTYSTTDALNLNLNYVHAEMLMLGLSGRVASRVFEGAVVSSAPNRKDDERSLTAMVNWMPTRYLGFTLSVIKSMRDTTTAYQSFEFDDVTTSLGVDLKI